MSRNYIVPLNGLSMTTAGEMLAINTPANKFCKIKRFVIKVVNNALPTAQQLQFEGTVFTVPTPGSGGTGVTAQPTQQGYGAASSGGQLGQSTPTTGTVGSRPYRDGCYAYQGIDAPAPGGGITLLSNQTFALTLVQAPAGAVSISFDGYLEIDEEG